MVKKIALLLGLLVLIPQPAYAVDYMTSTAADYQASRPAMTKPAKVMEGKTDKMLRIAEPLKKKSLKEQIQNISDARKKNIVGKIGDRLTTSNTNLTGKMDQALMRMSQILEKIASREATLSSSGTNTSALKTAITNAQNDITSAKTLVATQKTKTYTAELTDDTLGSVISGLVQQFKTDITAAHESVRSARTSLLTAMQELIKLTPDTVKTNTVVN